MVGVVGDEETYDLTELTFVLLLEGELKTTVLLTIVSLDGDFALILQACVVAAVAIDHREVEDVTLLPVGWIERASTQEDAEHVVDAVVVGVSLPCMAATTVLAVLLDLYLATRIAVEHLVYGIAFRLFCSLTIVDGRHVLTDVAEESVAHEVHLVGALIASCGE